MTNEAALRSDETPCLLFPELFPRGGGLQRSVQERASLFAKDWSRVLVLTTGFAPAWRRTVRELKARGSLDDRVVVRNFFAHSRWAAELGVPPEDAYAVPGEPDLVTKAQHLRGKPALRLADWHPGERYPFRYRYFDTAGRLRLTAYTGPRSKQEARAEAPDGTAVDWTAIVTGWVDEEIGAETAPVLFSLQRGFNDPVLLASRAATRKIASLHNCHYNDPDDRSSGIRPSFRPLFDNATKVDRIVCQTQQQLEELREDVPAAPLQAIRYPGRRAADEGVEKDPALVVLVAQLIDRKRVDHAIRAFPLVLEAVPHARLEIYGEGPREAALQALVVELGLEASVRLMGYSSAVGRAQAAAACSLLTSTFEGSPRVVTESMSRGTPAVAYTIRYGPRDLIRDGFDGLLVERHEPEALAAALVSLLSDPERVREMGRRAGEIVDRFPVADFERAWGEVLSAPPRRRTIATRARELGQRAYGSRTARRLRRLSRTLPHRAAPGSPSVRRRESARVG